MRRGGRRGFTVLECVIATFILLAGFLAVMSVYPLSQRASTTSQNHTQAIRVARNVLEVIRAHPYGEPLSSDVLADETYQGLIETDPGDASGKHAITTVTFRKSVTYANGSCVGAVAGSTTYDVATVTVRWREGTAGGSAGVDKSVKVTGGILRAP